MGIVKTDFIHIECNGPAAVPWKPHCGAEVDGAFNQDDVEAAAAAEGWTTAGRSWFCPRHSAAALQEKQTRKPRAVQEQSAD